MLSKHFERTLTLFVLLSLFTSPASARSDEEIAKQSQNPVAAIISLPMKNKFEFDRGSEEAFAYELEMQPVYPVSIGSMNLINRFIIPIAHREGAFPGVDDETGLRNITYQAFLSPADAGEVIWGVGPAINMPTNTDSSLGVDRWSGGPAALALTIQGPWVSGVLGQHFWDFAGDDNDEISLSTLQYFINYNTPDFYLNTSPTMSYNWEVDDDEWTIPVGGGIGKIYRFGELPVDVRLSAYKNVEAPDSAPDWFAEFQVKLIFPK